MAQPLIIRALLVSILMTLNTASIAFQQDSDLATKLATMIANDRTGVCIVTATIGPSIKRAAVCANKGDRVRRGLNFDTAFEIGSISKTMTATVLAGLIRDQGLSLNDTLQSILPKGTVVPSKEGRAILLKHVVTHSSGLPVIPTLLEYAEPQNPYAAITPDALYDALKKVELDHAPGITFKYSNFAMMLLSAGLANVSGRPFSELLQEYVFKPAGMKQKHTLQTANGAQLATGHSPLGEAVNHWDFHDELAGVGGVRASLNDMILYAQANLGLIESSNAELFTMTHVTVLKPSGQDMGMNWVRRDINGKLTLMHEGGTGGFSSLIMLDKSAKSGLVMLSDTALANLGGLSNIAFSLMNPSIPTPQPRLRLAAPTDLLSTLSGEYELGDTGMNMVLWHKNGTLYGQASGQNQFQMAYDSHGDFYPLGFDALLRPVRMSTGWGYEWRQGGGVLRAKPKIAENQKFKVSSKTLESYVGHYPLMQRFALKVAVSNGRLTIQGTNQPALAVIAVGPDEFSRDDVGAHFTFQRDAAGEVISVTLNQGGQTISGKKQ